ncbi:MAG: hypothetical protein ACQKBV_01250 [Puniceicoccales bacterium]
MNTARRYLSVDELRYLARAPKSLILEVLHTPAAKSHLVEIETFAAWDKPRQRNYLLAKHRLQELIEDSSRHENLLVDLSGLQLESLPPEIFFVVRRAKRFRLDLSKNRLTHYYLVRRSITRDQPDHPIPFDAINLDHNPIADLSSEIIQRGKVSAHYMEEYWLRHWAKPYTIANKVTSTMEMQRFTEPDVVNALKLMLHMTGAARAAELHHNPTQELFDDLEDQEATA